jgi:hypothetical protein
MHFQTPPHDHAKLITQWILIPSAPQFKKQADMKSKEEMTVRQLAVLFEHIANKKLNINWGTLPYKDREVMTIWDGGTIVPGWEPMVSLKQGLEEFILQDPAR